MVEEDCSEVHFLASKGIQINRPTHTLSLDMTQASDEAKLAFLEGHLQWLQEEKIFT